MKKYIIAAAAIVISSGIAYAAFKCTFCNGTGWKGNIKCFHCKGTGANGSY